MTINEKAIEAVILETDEIEFVCKSKKHKEKRKRRYKKKGKYVYDKYVYNDTINVIKRFFNIISTRNSRIRCRANGCY